MAAGGIAVEARNIASPVDGSRLSKRGVRNVNRAERAGGEMKSVDAAGAVSVKADDLAAAVDSFWGGRGSAGKVDRAEMCPLFPWRPMARSQSK
jgi:hypothetical protein